MRKKTVCDKHKANFETLRQAFADGNAALMECRDKTTGEIVAVICAVNHETNGDFSFVPFAPMVNGNPYERFEPPR